MIAARIVAGALWCAVAACASAPSPQVSAASTPSRPLDPAAPQRVETPTFMAELTGGSDQVTLTLEGRGEFHLNLEYPLKVELGGSKAAAFGKTTLVASDATQLDETRARFDATVRWHAPGPHWVGARVQFATCTPDTCTPHEVALAIALEASKASE